MNGKLTRREVVKSIPALALGSGILSFPGAVSPVLQRRNIVTSPPGPASKALLEKFFRYVGVSGYAGLYGVGLKNGDGIFIEDMDGNTYLDCFSAASCNILGYSRDEIARIYFDNAIRIQQTESSYSPNEQTAELAKLLTEITPGNFEKKALVGLTGSDSNCGAIEAARKYTGKMGIISFHLAYHGSTGLSQAASGFRSLNEGMYDLTDPDFIKVNLPVTEEEAERTLRNVETIISFGKTAAMMVEIVQGDGGTLIAPPSFFPGLRKLLDRYGVLMIDDEVQSGMGRTGRFWACEYENVVPDITVMGKGLSAGYAPCLHLSAAQKSLMHL